MVEDMVEDMIIASAIYTDYAELKAEVAKLRKEVARLKLPCSRCRGAGTYKVHDGETSDGRVYYDELECDECGGSGRKGGAT